MLTLSISILFLNSKSKVSFRFKLRDEIPNCGSCYGFNSIQFIDTSWYIYCSQIATASRSEQSFHADYSSNKLQKRNKYRLDRDNNKSTKMRNYNNEMERIVSTKESYKQISYEVK